MTRTQVQDMVQHTTDLCQSYASTLQQHIDQLKVAIKENQPEKVINKLEKTVNSLSKPFSGLETEHKRMREFEKMGMVKSETHVVGTRYETHKGVRELVDNTYEYVSVVETIKKLVDDQRVDLSNREGKAKQSNDGRVIRTFEDGLRYKKNTLLQEHPDTLQIVLYHDDIELANPLGSKAGVNKMTMMYMSIRKQHLPCQLADIHLVMSAHAADVKEFGFSKLMNPLLYDLKLLEEGLMHNDQTIRGVLTHIIGDNLAMNQIFGFVESFSADYFCRFCMMPRQETQHSAGPVPSELYRTHDTHSGHCEEAKTDKKAFRRHGVKSSLLLDDLVHFNSVESMSADIMHDLLEGIVKVELALILQSYVNRGVFTLRQFNLAIDGFNYR